MGAELLAERLELRLERLELGDVDALRLLLHEVLPERSLRLHHLLLRHLPQKGSEDVFAR